MSFWALTHPDPERAAGTYRLLQLAAHFLGQVSADYRSRRLHAAISSSLRGIGLLKEKAASELAQKAWSTVGAGDVIVWKREPLAERDYLIAEGATLTDAVQIQVGTGIVGRAFQDSKTVVVDDLTCVDEVHKYAPEGIQHQRLVNSKRWHAGVFVPLDAGGENIGVLAAYFHAGRAPDSLEVEVLRAFASLWVMKSLLQLANAERALDRERIERNSFAVQAGTLAMERIHDASEGLGWAANSFNLIQDGLGLARPDTLKKHITDGKEGLAKAQKLVGRIRRVLNSKDLAGLSKQTKLKVEEHSLVKIIEELLDLYKSDLTNIEKHVRGSPDVTALVDDEYIERAFGNVIRNAIYFLKHTQRTPRKLEIEVTSDGESSTVVVKDNGPGIRKEDMSKIFGLFFSTKASDGMGVGLAIAKRIVEAHSGAISVSSVWGQGAEFRITLPNKKA